MTFKAKLQTQYARIDTGKHIENIIPEFSEVFSFNRQVVKFTGRQKMKYANNLNLTPFSTNFQDNTEYKIIKKEERGKVVYRMEIDKLMVDVTMSKWNEYKMNWINKNTYIQSDSSNWLKAALIAALTYFIGQWVGYNIGFNKGYENGLKQGTEKVLKANPLNKTLSNK